jgi:mannose-1-phosphate guanylyltransferase/mannose-6-phosphate isomerase
MNIYPIILSGGSGSRLWPLSREYYPKPLLSLVTENTLLQDTASRLDGLPGVMDAIYVCNEEHRFLIAEQANQLGKGISMIILEPEGRNTAPALTLAALYIAENDPQGVMVVMPADHVINDIPKFCEAVKLGCTHAENGALVTFGIVPDSAETSYGYIKRAARLDDGLSFAVERFVEKPDRETAEVYVSSQDYFWNSGIFVMRASSWLEEIERYRTDISAACKRAFSSGRTDIDFLRIGKDAFLSCPSDSIDYAVMEKTDNAVMIPFDGGWSDIGAWSSLWDVSPHDADGNVLHGDVMAEGTSNSFLSANHRYLAVVGMKDVVVVETADAVLVANKNKAQDVKLIVARLKKEQREESRSHRKIYRPWGSYEGVDSGHRFQVKRLIVNPGASLSLQMHHQRAEHWVVVKGVARVTLGEQVFNLHEDQSTYIPIGEKHRLENPGDEPLEVIEVQSGSYLGEDDIVRFEDIYDRCNEN